MEAVLAKGVSKDKIVVGFAFYGRSFTLANPANTGFDSQAWNPGAAGPCTVSAGSMAWFEIDAWRKGVGVTTKFDPITQTIYSYKDNFWIGYDDSTTIALKGMCAMI